ncbi:MAG: hypothetical protein GY810_19595 [Aureispira sp.]|nr:hypothetical protein [Aureispira sp.]
MKFFSMLVVLLLITFSSQITYAQQNKLQAVNNPNLEQKRLDAANPRTPTQPKAKSASMTMAMASKYEETAIRKWKRENPRVEFFNQDDYDQLPPKKQEQVQRYAIVYKEKIKWTDIEQFKEKHAVEKTKLKK